MCSSTNVLTEDKESEFCFCHKRLAKKTNLVTLVSLEIQLCWCDSAQKKKMHKKKKPTTDPERSSPRTSLKKYK